MSHERKRMPRQIETSGADAMRLGGELRDARLALGLSVDEVAARLRIRRAHLLALEEGRLSDLPALAYATGHVRSYAEALGLPPAELARRFRDAAGRGEAKPDLAFPAPLSGQRLPGAALTTLAGIVAICGYVAWFNLSGGERSVDAVPPVPARLEMAVDAGAAQLPGREARARPGAGPLPLAALPPPGGVPPGSSTGSSSGANTSAQAATVGGRVAAPPVAEPRPAEPPAPSASEPAEAEPAPPPIPSMPEGTRIVLRAGSASPEGAWVQVRDPRSGGALVNRVLRPGEAWAVPGREGLLLDTGKADNLEILLDGQPQPVLEGLIGVRRNIALEPERLRQRLGPATAAGRVRN